MASSVVTVVFLLAVSLCLLQVEGLCRSKGKGKLNTFNDEKAYIKLPCKYHATTIHCDGYRIHVAPGQAFDSKFRLYTKTAWISIEKDGFYWRGRTSVKIIKNYLETNLEEMPFRPKYLNMDGAPFTIEWSADSSDISATISVADAFDITLYSYDAKFRSARKRNGVEITCSNATNMDKSHYPASFCGNNTDINAIRLRKKELGLKSKSTTLIYDLLDNQDVVQTNPQCEVAVDVFANCPADKSEVVMDCSEALMSKDIIKCLKQNNDNPMDVFVHCLKYKCNNDATSCDSMKAAMLGCPNLAAVPDTCPGV